jgi:hypothetical protein
MNWRRGLFRLWIVGSVLFVIAFAVISYSEIKAQFSAVAPPPPPQGSEILVPQLCEEARGVAGTDYTTQKGQNPGPWDKYAKPEPYDDCWYTMSKFRPLYPEFNNLSDYELIRMLYGIRVRPWATLGIWASIAVGIPLAVLIIGASLVWAFSGFAAKRRP